MRIAIAFAILGLTLPTHDSWINKGGYRNSAGEWCCGEGDCSVVPRQHVSLRPDGYHVLMSLIDGQSYGEEVIPENRTTPSPDGAYWACRRPDRTIRCFFAPPPGS